MQMRGVATSNEIDVVASILNIISPTRSLRRIRSSLLHGRPVTNDRPTVRPSVRWPVLRRVPMTISRFSGRVLCLLGPPFLGSLIGAGYFFSLPPLAVYRRSGFQIDLISS